mgnify:CR=1 FL=1
MLHSDEMDCIPEQDSIPGLDRRQSPRFPYQSIITLKLAGGMEIKGQIKNISTYGLLFVPDNHAHLLSVKRKQMGHVSFPLFVNGCNFPIDSKFRIARVSQEGIAVEFINLDIEQLSALERFIVQYCH